jgi:hypothetical protein
MNRTTGLNSLEVVAFAQGGMILQDLRHRNPDLMRMPRGRTVYEEGKVLSKIRPGAGCQFFPALA